MLYRYSLCYVDSYTIASSDGTAPMARVRPHHKRLPWTHERRREHSASAQSTTASCELAVVPCTSRHSKTALITRTAALVPYATHVEMQHRCLQGQSPVGEGARMMTSDEGETGCDAAVMDSSCNLVHHQRTNPKAAPAAAPPPPRPRAPRPPPPCPPKSPPLRRSAQYWESTSRPSTFLKSPPSQSRKAAHCNVTRIVTDLVTGTRCSNELLY